MKKSILTSLLLFMICSLGLSQVEFSGTVTDENSEPVIGATVRVQDSSIGAITDVNGNYLISGVNAGDVIIASFVGMEDAQHTVAAGETSHNFVLTQGSTALEDVVIIGYGEVEKDDLTGSVTSVSSEEFNKGSISSAQELLAGKTPGVVVTQGGGAPGDGSQIRIRGGASLSASNDPLIIIDEVPIENGTTAGSRNILNTLNPNDIESFTVLKDASATAIYGSRASNGVIIITTKSGKSGEFKYGYNGLFSVSTVDETLDVLSGDELREYVNQTGDDTEIGYLGNQNTDWQDQIFSNSFGQQHNFSASGEAFNFLPLRISVGTDLKEGILNTSEFDRYTGALKFTPQFLDGALRLNGSVKYSHENNTFADRGAIGAAVRMDPTQPVFVPEYTEFGGYYEWTAGMLNNGNLQPYGLGTRNPVSLIEQRDNESKVNRVIANLKTDYELPFLSGLTATLNLGIDKSEGEGEDIRPATAASAFAQVDGVSYSGNHSVYNQERTNKVLDTYLKYDLAMGDNSTFDITGGYTWQEFNYYNFSNRLDTANVEALGLDVLRIDESVLNLVSFFGRANFDINDKYLLTATVRRDGTSRFTEDNRWGTFPAVSAAWKIGNEAFFDNVDFLSNLKLRAGWGVTGQQDVGTPDQTLSRYVVASPNANYLFGGTPYTTYRASGYNSTLKWEETTTLNGGIDFGFFNNRIIGFFDVYQKESEDLIVNTTLPAGSNLTNALNANVGDLESEGWEFNIGGYPVDNDSFSWNTNFNVAYNDVEITNLETSDNILVGGIQGGTGNTIQVHTEGFAPSSFYVYRQVYDENGDPLNGVYIDRNGDNIINEQDLYRYENPAPDYTFGFTNQFYMGNWDASFTLRAAEGNYNYNNLRSDAANFSAVYNNTSINNVLSSVQETEFTSVQYFSDIYIEDASFIRMDNATLGYTFDDIDNANMTIKLYGAANNLFTITDYSGLDPEITGGIDTNFFPRARTFSLGANVNF